MAKTAWDYIVAANRVFTVLVYPMAFVFQATIYWNTSLANARRYRNLMIAMWLPVSALFYYYTVFAGAISHWSLGGRITVHVLFFGAWDVAFMAMTFIACLLDRFLSMKRENQRVMGAAKSKFYGKKICILGNGPSLAQGEPLGHLIDGMDEVIRFNNFQTKASGLEQWTGTKCTVHFSDSMLYPSYPEYYCPGASIVLALFMDRLMVAGSYFVFRIAADLAFKETFGMMFNPSLSWVPETDILALKQHLGLDGWRHPTSGCLAIDWFSRNRPDDSEPIYIHGFDFFEGPTIHYYDKTEPWYERLNDFIGVTMMHQPHKEKGFVEQLVKEGKVKWLRDLAK